MAVRFLLPSTYQGLYHILSVTREDVITLFTKLIGKFILYMHFTLVSYLYMQVKFAKPSIDFTQLLGAISN